MSKRKIQNKWLEVFFLVIFIGSTSLCYTQTFNISNPTIGFTQACASANFNTYNFSFSFFPVQNLGSSNEFIVELSDANGGFDSPTVVRVLTNTTSPVSSNFNLPISTYGENYRIRVRSTDPARISNPSNFFSAYYAIHNQPYSINNNIGSVFLCSGEQYELSIDATGTPASPLFYPNLSYKWYKNYTEMPGETGSSIMVYEPGTYYSIVDYGSCIMNSYSNMVQFQFEPDIAPEIIASNLLLCPNETLTLTSSLQNANYIYKWFKDNNEILNSNSPTYNVLSEGVYHLSIGSNGCFFDSDFVEIDSYDFTVSIDTASPLIIIPGVSQTIGVQTTALNPQFQWSYNGTPLAGETSTSLEVNTIGDYTVTVSENSPCVISNSDTISVIFPDVFDIVVSASSDYVSCQSSATVLSLSLFETEINNTTIDLLQTTTGFSYQWYKDNQLVVGANGTTLALNNAAQNGTYKLAISYPNFQTIFSNEIAIHLILGNVIVESDSDLCEGGSVQLSSSVTEVAYAYQWFLNGELISGASNPNYLASIAGDYHLEITSGDCSAISNTLSLSVSTITITSNSPTNVVLIPGQTQVLSIMTNASSPEYAWYVDNQLIVGEIQSSLSVTIPGIYKVVVSENLTCYNEIELLFTVSYPSDFAVYIGADNYVSCQSSPVILALEELTTVISGTTIIIPNSTSFNYQWYKDGVLIPNANLSTYTISDANQNGNYYLEVEIPGVGVRVSNSVLIELFSVSNLTITPDGPFCTATSEVIISSSITELSYNYQWFLDNQPITGANSSVYTATDEGIYYLEISSGNCIVSSNPISLTLGVLDVISSSNALVVLIPGQTENLFINTNAINPTYEWFLNDILIASVTSNSLVVDTPGIYKVLVTQSDECDTEIELEFEVVYPTSFSVTIATDASYEICQNNPVSLNLVSLNTIINSNQVAIPISSSFTYQWFKDGIAVLGANAESLILNSDSLNGNYVLEVTISGVGSQFSNSESITLFTTTAPEISLIGVLCPNTSVVLNSSVNSSNYNYQWYLDGALIAGATDTTYNATTAGSYAVTVSLANCTIQSNPLSVISYDFDLIPLSPIQDIILPGDSKQLTISTNALNPQISWYKNNNLIVDANSVSYITTEPGTYRVKVVQTQNCTIEKEIEFELSYPISIAATISADANYQPCVSTSVTLTINSFLAFSAFGNYDLIGNTFGYTYQWMKNGNPVSGATSNQLFLNQYANNGLYSLEITIPNFGVILTNAVNVQLPALTSLSIVSDGVLCDSNPTVTLSTNFNEPTAVYEWFSTASNIVIGSGLSLAVTEIGDYFLTVTYEGCTINSNIVAVTAIDESLITVNQNSIITIDEGETVLIEANGAETYAWYFNGILIAATSSVTISEPGFYTLIATIGNCQVVKEFNLIVIANNVQAIPNIVTPNNDGFNDLWKLPSKFTKENVEIIIYDGSGNVVFRTSAYQNNWPNENTVLSNKSLVFYYTISEDYEITKKGTITVVK